MHGQHAPLLESSCSLTGAELDAITATMPMTARYSIPDGAFDGWALLFRDHYLPPGDTRSWSKAYTTAAARSRRLSLAKR
jgi:hypothetical protein